MTLCALHRSPMPQRAGRLVVLNPAFYLQQFKEKIEAFCDLCVRMWCFHHYGVALGEVFDPFFGYQPSAFQAKPSASCS